jgi:adenine-specific DNA-methyltransferase
MKTLDLTDENIKKLRELFPNCVTETLDTDNKLQLAIDFDLLKQELSHSIVVGPVERYQLDWPGKRESLLAANAPIAKTLRPIRDESINFDETENLFIEGDNLEALKLLQESYLGKVKMIYIDPPYNTGSDFVYSDDFAEDSKEYFERSLQKDENGNRLVANSETRGRYHSDWLSMMHSRLRLARNVLADDGVIMIHIDEYEYVNLGKLLSEVFGENNNLGTIVWDKRNPKGDAIGVSQQHEYVIVFCKNISFFKEFGVFNTIKPNAQKILNMAEGLIANNQGIINSDVKEKFKKWMSKQSDLSGGEKAYDNIDDDGNVFREVSMAWPNKKMAPKDYWIPLKHPKTGENCKLPSRGWRNPSSTMALLLSQNLIIFGKDENTIPNRKYLLKDNVTEKMSSLLYYGGSDDSLLESLEVVFDTPKPMLVAKKLIQSVCKQDDLVLDFFAGSATTAHAVMQLNAEDGGNRKFIMVQLPEETDEKSEACKAGYKNIAEISKERIRRAGKQILESDNINANWNRDIGFRVLKTDESNMKDVFYKPQALNQSQLFDQVDNVKEDRNAEDLLFQIMLDWGLELSLPVHIETIQGKQVYCVAEDALIACFDKDITEELVKELANKQPMRLLFRDNYYANNDVKINAGQLVKQLSPKTELKSI